MKCSKYWKSEDGSAGPQYVFIVIIILVIAAVVIDYARPAYNARLLQNAADSAAMAAAHELPVKTSDTAAIAEIKNVAIEYAGKNGFTDSSAIRVELSEISNNEYRKVTVTIDQTVSYTLARILGETETTVTRSASAQLFALSGVKNTIPLSIEKSEMDSQISSGNYFMTLKFGGGGGSNGAYGAIDPDGDNGGGANDFRDRLKYGYDEVLYAGSSIPIEPGNMSGPTGDAIDYRCGQCNHYPENGGCTPSLYDPDCPRIVIIPIVSYVSAHSVKIEGFAPFLLDSYTGSGNTCYVYGTYLPVYMGEGEVDFSNSTHSYGVYTTIMVD